mgnify:CR=1 FL=1
MRITIVISALGRGGAERIATMFASDWAKAGHTVALVSLNAALPDMYPVDPAIQRVRLDLSGESRSWTAIQANVRRIRELRRTARDLAPDVIVSFGDKTSTLSVFSTWGLGVPVIAYETTDPTNPERRLPLPWRVLRRLGYARASAVVVLAESIRDRVAAWRPQPNLVLIPNPIPAPLVAWPRTGEIDTPRKRVVTPQDLTRQPFILFEAGSNSRRTIEEFFAKEQVAPKVVTETENVEIIKALVRIRMGISIVPYQAVADGFRGEALIARGEVEEGVGILRNVLPRLHADRYELYASGFGVDLSLGLATLGRVPEALELIGSTISRVSDGGEAFDMAELLRVRGHLQVLRGDEDAARRSLMSSIELAEVQGAISWRLRSEMSMVELAGKQDRKAAISSLAKTLARFSEGHETADLRSARRLLGDAG